MPFAIGSTAAKDGDGVAIPGGLLSANIASGDSPTGPTFLFNGLVDGLAGVNRAQITVANALKVEGTGATGATLAGSPFRISGAHNTTPPTVTDGQAVDLQATTRGELKVSLSQSAVSVAQRRDDDDAQAPTTVANSLATMSRMQLFDPAAAGTFPRWRGTALGGGYIQGGAAHDNPVAGNPILVGGYGSATAPSDVSAGADAVRAWRLLNGAAATVLTAAGALIGGDALNGLDVDVTRLPPLVEGTEHIGDVTALDAVLVTIDQSVISDPGSPSIVTLAEGLAVSGITSIVAIPPGATHARVAVEAGASDVGRVTEQGTNPTATIGEPIYDRDVLYIDANLNNYKFYLPSAMKLRVTFQQRA